MACIFTAACHRFPNHVLSALRTPQVLAPKWIMVQAWFRACRFEDSQGLQCLGLMARCFAAASQHFHQHAPDKPLVAEKGTVKRVLRKAMRVFTSFHADKRGSYGTDLLPHVVPT